MATLRNVTTGQVLATSVTRTLSGWDRLVGCLRFARLGKHEGIWLQPCSAVHTIGMRTRLDVIFLDAASVVVALRPKTPPNRPVLTHPHARAVVEMGPGFLDARQVELGDELALVDSEQPVLP